MTTKTAWEMRDSWRFVCPKTFFPGEGWHRASWAGPNCTECGVQVDDAIGKYGVSSWVSNAPLIKEEPW